MHLSWIIVAGACGLAAAGAGAQQPITRSDAVAAALEHGPRLAVARADTAAARALSLTARAYPNPVLATSYSKSVPQLHATIEVPLDYPWVRNNRIASARSAERAAQYRFAYEHAAIALEADTTYTVALAAQAHARLSRRNAEAADSLLRMAVLRRDAGDASELDVELASVSAGQQANLAAADSLAYASALLDLQAVMGVVTDRSAITLGDTLGFPPTDSAVVALAGTPLTIAAAEEALSSAESALRLQSRSLFLLPSITAGVEGRDPTRSEPGILPTVGLSIPLPLLDRNRGPIAQAKAERERAAAELTLARVESETSVARARRERAIALARATRDRALIASADRVAAMSLRGYQEGALTLPNVLEAQRAARDVLGQYIDDLAAAWNASAALRVYTLTVSSPPMP